MGRELARSVGVHAPTATFTKRNYCDVGTIHSAAAIDQCRVRPEPPQILVAIAASRFSCGDPSLRLIGIAVRPGLGNAADTLARLSKEFGTLMWCVCRLDAAQGNEEEKN